jgi:hypothetical protein
LHERLVRFTACSSPTCTCLGSRYSLRRNGRLLAEGS